jgi:hypothetical protein
MGIRIKIRRRAPLPTPWKWEIFDDASSKLVTGSRLSYASQRDACVAGELVLAAMVKSKPV